MSDRPWLGRRAAVSLSYDDARVCHHRDVAPLLDERGLHATFYTALNDDFFAHLDAWRQVAATGHELGNHTCFHPCRGADDRPWVKPDSDLRRYDARRWIREVHLANQVLTSVDGAATRSYGNTCHETLLGTDADHVSIDDLVLDQCIAARGSERTDPCITRDRVDRRNLGTTGGDGRSAEELIALASEALERRAWIILCIHGVGEKGLSIDADEHRRFIDWLVDRQTEITVAPVARICKDLAAAGD